MGLEASKKRSLTTPRCLLSPPRSSLDISLDNNLGSA